jgi:hypothetical protein
MRTSCTTNTFRLPTYSPLACVARALRYSTAYSILLYSIVISVIKVLIPMHRRGCCCAVKFIVDWSVYYLTAQQQQQHNNSNSNATAQQLDQIRVITVVYRHILWSKYNMWSILRWVCVSCNTGSLALMSTIFIVFLSYVTPEYWFSVGRTSWLIRNTWNPAVASMDCSFEEKTQTADYKWARDCLVGIWWS